MTSANLKRLENELGPHLEMLVELDARPEPHRSIDLFRYVVNTRDSSVFTDAIRAAVLGMNLDFRYVVAHDVAAAYAS